MKSLFHSSVMPPVAFDWENNFSASFISGDQCAFQFFSFISMPAGTVLIFQLFSFYFQPFSKVDDFFFLKKVHLWQFNHLLVVFLNQNCSSLNYPTDL